MNEYVVVEYCDGEIRGVVAGGGKNKGTWDATHSRSAAYRLRKEMTQKHPDKQYRVETAY